MAQKNLFETLREQLRSLGHDGDAWLDKLERMASDAPAAERFADVVMVGLCPSCGSDATSDCEDAPGIDDLTVGICTSCIHLWCLECGTALSFREPSCPNWEKPDHGVR
jgi:hypothetical protein